MAWLPADIDHTALTLQMRQVVFALALLAVAPASAAGGGAARLFGVNYYAPFSASYDQMRREKVDPRKAIRDDVSQFARLGLNGIRVHYYDRDISTSDGGLVENEHLALMDEVVALCASNGIRTVVTLMCGWNTPCDIGGFAGRWKRSELTSSPDAIAAQCRFAGEIVRHVNPFTGRRYADDPAIAAFELFNEPSYPKGFADEKVTAYVNALSDAVRAAGSRKPLYYNCWQKREKASVAARIDGVAAAVYPTGLDSGAARIGNRLSQVKGSAIRDVPELRGLKKMIYEFDAADVPGAYMYPAMVRQFCAEGFDMAFQFHYLATAIAPRNLVNRTHHLNLFHTPAKAMSLAIAAEVFRRLPHGEHFEPAHDEMSFPPFRIVPSENLSEMATEHDFLYTADTETRPPAPGSLRRVWGCGKSPVCQSGGNGCYFLDRCAAGVWRLQLAPSVLEVADPYTGKPCVKTAILPDEVEMSIRLDDVGPEYSVWRLGGTLVKRAAHGCVILPAGDYVLTREAAFDEGARMAVHSLSLPPFSPPPPGGGDKRSAAEKPKGELPVHEESLFDPRQAVNAHRNGAKISRDKDADGFLAVAVRLANLTTASTYASITSGCGDSALERVRGKKDCGAIVVRARASEPATTKIEMVIEDSRGYAWSCVVPLETAWRDVEIPLAKFRPNRHVNGRLPPEGLALDLGKAVAINFGIGKWLFPKSSFAPHGFAVSSVTAADLP